jgi:lysophospholipase L1-like esterase
MSRAIPVLLVLASPLAAADDILRDKARVVFLGDSNTFAGRFIAYLEAYSRTRHPDRNVQLINLGLPSETVSGLSEPDHPYPRPNVHDRLAAALTKTKPTTVVVCYGMNDGIYYPYDEERFRKYQDGYRKLIAECEKAGAKVVLMTPAPFDAKPLKDKVQPKGAEKYSWLKPYADYDEDVLKRYAEWLVTFRDKGYLVADAHSAVRAHLDRMRKIDPTYTVSGDGIHPDASGHYVIFRELATTLGIPLDGLDARIDAAAGKSESPGVANVKVGLGKLEFTWKAPAAFPRDSAWHHRLSEIEAITGGVGRFRLAVAGLPEGKHSLYEGDRLIGTATADEWKKGVNLGKWNELSANKRTAELWDLVQKKQRILGLAWLTDVGHKRPDTRKGIPLPDAIKYGEEIDGQVRELLKAPDLKLRVVSENK